MIESKPHTPELTENRPTEVYASHASVEAAKRLLGQDRRSTQAHIGDKVQEIVQDEALRAAEQELSLDHETAAYLQAEDNRTYSLYVNPSKVPNIARLTEDSKEAVLLPQMQLQKSRVEKSIERDLGLRVSSQLLGVKFLDESQTEKVKKTEKNVSSWVKYTLERGDRRNSHLDKYAVKAIGAILDREIIEAANDEIKKEIVLEDRTHKKSEKVVVADDNYHLAEELTTGSHKTINELDEVIIRERKKVSHKLQRVGSFLVEKVRDHLPHGGPGQPQPA